MDTEKLLTNNTSYYCYRILALFYSCLRVKFTLRLNDQGVIKVFMVTCSIWIVKQNFCQMM
jgi:hypothetical protein